MFNHNEFYYFYQITPSEGEYSFISYADSLTGNTYKAIQSTDQSGKDRPFVVKFSRRERIYRFPKKQKVYVKVNGDSPKLLALYDYIKNFPETEGSPYANGSRPRIKELDEVKDAKVGVDRKKRRLDAGNVVMGMKAPERAAFAPLIAVYNDDPDVILHRLLEFADNDPEAFFKFYEAPDKELRSLIKKALAAGVIKRQGAALIYEKEVYGDEDDMISNLLKSEEKLKSLKANTNKLK